MANLTAILTKKSTMTAWAGDREGRYFWVWDTHGTLVDLYKSTPNFRGHSHVRTISLSTLANPADLTEVREYTQGLNPDVVAQPDSTPDAWQRYSF